MENKENLKFFNQPEEADKWVWRIENVVVGWVRKHCKSYWYVVLWESKRNGTLREDITRDEFAELLVQECPGALYENDNADRIKYNIEKFPYKEQLKELQLSNCSSVPQYVKELSEALTCDVPEETIAKDFTLVGRMQEYLTMTTAKESYVKVLVRPTYNGKVASFSVENYVSERFMKEGRPSRTVIFECVEEAVTEEKVDMLYGRFGTLTNTKLFIASTHSFSGNVKLEAERHSVGLVLVNPKYAVKGNDFVLPRTQSSQQPEDVLWLKMLEGQRIMTIPILVYDNGRIDDSLSFILYKHALCNQQNLFVPAPHFTDDEIESIALRLIRPLVDSLVSKLRKCSTNDKVPDCSIDLNSLAMKLELKVSRGKIENKLGQIEMEQKKVTLSNQLESDNPSDRFSLAHEIGHHILHRKVCEKAKDGVHTIVSKNKKWLEQHANHFASFLLMPTNVIRLLYNIYWKKEFKCEDVAPLNVQAVYYEDPIFQRVVCPIARKMKVSPEAAFIRLKGMGLVLMRAKAV